MKDERLSIEHGPKDKPNFLKLNLVFRDRLFFILPKP